MRKDLQEIFDVISEKFDKMSNARDKAIPEHREIIKMSSLVIRAVHRDEFAEAAELLAKTREKLTKLSLSLREFPEVYHGGFLHDCQKEFAEASITLSLVEKGVLPKPNEIGVDFPAYLNGAGEAIGELRRNIVDKLRKNKTEIAEKFLEWMDEIYYVLISMDYPDAITMSLRRTADVARSLIEKTRGEIAVHVRQNSLEQKMQKLEEKLK